MVNLVNLEKISIKNHPEINEKMIQKYLSEHPEVLGLGRLELRGEEKIFQKRENSSVGKFCRPPSALPCRSQ